MSSAAISIFVFGIYLVFLGSFILIAPNTLLTLTGLPPTNEVWIRLVGMLLLFLAFYYIQAARHGVTPFFRWTLYTRCSAIVFLLAFIISGLVKPVILLFWMVDLAGAIWTGLSIRSGSL